ncbi:MAG: hypothetical protein HYZ47_02990 [Simkania negevensis]|nr:hypothetical protein [Simkania negevensis]
MSSAILRSSTIYKNDAAARRGDFQRGYSHKAFSREQSVQDAFQTLVDPLLQGRHPRLKEGEHFQMEVTEDGVFIITGDQRINILEEYESEPDRELIAAKDTIIRLAKDYLNSSQKTHKHSRRPRSLRYRTQPLPIHGIAGYGSHGTDEEMPISPRSGSRSSKSKPVSHEDVESLRQRISSLEGHNSYLLQQLQEKDLNINNLSEQQAQSQRDILQLNSQLQAAQAKLEGMYQQLLGLGLAYGLSQGYLAALSEQRNQLQAQVAANHAQIETLGGIAYLQSNTIDAQARIIQELIDANHNLASQIQEKDEEISNLAEDLDKTEASAVEAENALKQAKKEIGDKDEQISALQKKIRSRDSLLQELLNDKQKLSSQIQAGNEEIASLRKEKTAVEKENAGLKDTVDELREHLRDLEEENEELERVIEKNDETISLLEWQLADLGTTNKQQSETIIDLRKQIENLTQANRQLAQQKAENLRKIAEDTNTIQDLRKNLQEKEEEIRSLKQDKESVEKEKLELEETLRIYTDESAETSKQIQDIESQLLMLGIISTTFAAKIQENIQTISKLEREVASLKRTNQDQSEAIADLKKQILTLQEINQKLSEESKENSNKIKQLEVQNQELQRKMRLLEDVVADKEKIIEKAGEQFAKLQEKHSNTLRELEEQRAKAAGAEDAIKQVLKFQRLYDGERALQENLVIEKFEADQQARKLKKALEKEKIQVELLKHQIIADREKPEKTLEKQTGGAFKPSKGSILDFAVQADKDRRDFLSQVQALTHENQKTSEIAKRQEERIKALEEENLLFQKQAATAKKTADTAERQFRTAETQLQEKQAKIEELEKAQTSLAQLQKEAEESRQHVLKLEEQLKKQNEELPRLQKENEQLRAKLKSSPEGTGNEELLKKIKELEAQIALLLTTKALKALNDQLMSVRAKNRAQEEEIRHLQQLVAQSKRKDLSLASKATVLPSASLKALSLPSAPTILPTPITPPIPISPIKAKTSLPLSTSPSLSLAKETQATVALIQLPTSPLVSTLSQLDTPLQVASLSASPQVPSLSLSSPLGVSTLPTSLSPLSPSTISLPSPTSQILSSSPLSSESSLPTSPTSSIPPSHSKSKAKPKTSSSSTTTSKKKSSSKMTTSTKKPQQKSVVSKEKEEVEKFAERVKEYLQELTYARVQEMLKENEQLLKQYPTNDDLLQAKVALQKLEIEAFQRKITALLEKDGLTQPEVGSASEENGKMLIKYPDNATLGALKRVLIDKYLEF